MVRLGQQLDAVLLSSVRNHLDIDRHAAAITRRGGITVLVSRDGLTMTEKLKSTIDPIFHLIGGLPITDRLPVDRLLEPAGTQLVRRCWGVRVRQNGCADRSPGDLPTWEPVKRIRLL